MQVIHGRIQKFLRGRAGEIIGFILDSGIEVQFPSAHSKHVSAIAEFGSHMEIHGWMRPGPAGGTQFDATAIVNCDANQIVYLKESPHDPEMPFSSTATSEADASLALPSRNEHSTGVTAKK